ncbi:MAG: metallophosphoesterase [Bacteroidia bacterium]|nr:metallophosphoesterase [Bacteroidia bacterium]
MYKISFAFFLCCLAILQPAAAQVNVTRGPYLQKPTPTSMVVAWRTDVATDSRVSYGSSPSTLTTQVDDATAVTDHFVEITGLSPDTKYFYSFGSTSAVLGGATSDHHFKTFPPTGSDGPVKIWAIGDFGKANTHQENVRDAFINHPEYTQTDLWLWMGDNAYDSGTDSEFQTKVFDIYPSIFQWLPLYPVPGNHDYTTIAPPLSNISPLQHSGPYYDIVDVPTQGECGGVPSGTEAYYSFDLGNVHFVAANSEIGCVVGSTNDWIGVYPLVNPFASNFTSSPFTDWLHQDLSQNTKRWTVVYFHQPPFTDGSHETGTFYEVYMKAMRENIIPILYQYNVDLVVCGHSHVFERSYLIKDHADDANTWNPATMLVDGSSGTDSLGEAYVKDLNQVNGAEGTVFVVVGNSASTTTSPGLNYPCHYYGDGCDTCVGSFIIDADHDTLRGRYLKASGEIGDDFTIHKFGTLTSNTSDINPVISALETFPNPFENELNLRFQLHQAGQVRIELVSLNGAQTWKLHDQWQKPGPLELSFNTRSLKLAAGSYLLRCHAGEKVFEQKVIRVK